MGIQSQENVPGVRGELIRKVDLNNDAWPTAKSDTVLVGQQSGGELLDLAILGLTHMNRVEIERAASD